GSRNHRIRSSGWDSRGCRRGKLSGLHGRRSSAKGRSPMIQRNATNVTVSWIRAAIIILSFTLLHATADPSRGIQTEVPQPAPSAEHLTHGLAGLIHRYQTAAPEDQGLLVSQLTSAAVTRRDHLDALIET